MHLLRIVLYSLIAFAAGLAPATTHAAIYSTVANSVSQENGNPVSGSAEFLVNSGILTVVLTNTSADTNAQGDMLTGFVVDLASAHPLTFQSMSLTAGSTVFSSKTASNPAAPISGSWTSALTSSAYDFGMATTGVGLFNGGSITRGNASPDYGIAAAGAFPTTTFGGSKFPFIQNSLTFTFSGASGLDLNDIASVKLIFGTAAPGLINTELEDDDTGTSGTVPEPASWLVFAGLLGGLGWFGRSRKSK